MFGENLQKFTCKNKGAKIDPHFEKWEGFALPDFKTYVKFR